MGGISFVYVLSSLLNNDPSLCPCRSLQRIVEAAKSAKETNTTVTPGGPPVLTAALLNLKLGKRGVPKEQAQSKKRRESDGREEDGQGGHPYR